MRTRPAIARFGAILTLLTCVSAAYPIAAHAAPNFDAVSWTVLGCDVADMIEESNPGSASFTGDQANPAASYAYDADYLYFRYRVDADPSGAHGFDQYSWTALMQVPSGNRFQYQYQLSLNGKDDTIEIWQNTVASDIDFSPLFHDDSEVQLFVTPYTNGALARFLPAGTSFNGQADYFVDFAFPIATLIAEGVIANASELGQSFFFPATSTNPSNYNKSFFHCPFQPYTSLMIHKSVQPALAPVNASTPVTYSIDVQNAMGLGVGVIIEDVALPAFLSNVAVQAQSNDPDAVFTVVSTNPLLVKAPTLAAGKTVTVTMTADAAPGCGTADFVNTATARATNALEQSGSATLDVQNTNGTELCDGKDNDCDGQVDEGGAALCGDANPCTVDSCGGSNGCGHTAIPGCLTCSTPSDCNDGNACTTETCNGGVCGYQTIAGCEPCQIASDCASDGNACTTETCTDGVCSRPALPGCEPCQTAGDCASDGNACTTETCTDGVCSRPAIPGCEPCQTAGDCPSDGNACTTETCTDGVCSRPAIPGCEPCATAGDCASDGNACTTETCTDGVCSRPAIPGCEPCQTAGDCVSDGNACTTETCTDGVCSRPAIPGCEPCQTAGDCVSDGNACTTETCTDGVCSHPAIAGCEPCHTASDCASDGNACTTESCTDGVCSRPVVDGCIPCEADGDCNDEDRCTSDTCVDGMCQATQIAGCGPEVCDDNVDNDGDGLIDCEDSDCDGFAGCLSEICGDCLDNDHDGLTDYEDPDCCVYQEALTVRRMRLQMRHTPSRNKLRLKAKYLTRPAARMNLAQDGATLQVSDSAGQVVCQNIPLATSKRGLKRGVYKFVDRTGLRAGGLRVARVKVRKDGRVVFRVKGKKMNFRSPAESNPLVTLHMGNACMYAVPTLHVKTRKLGTNLVLP